MRNCQKRSISYSKNNPLIMTFYKITHDTNFELNQYQNDYYSNKRR